VNKVPDDGSLHGGANPVSLAGRSSRYSSIPLSGILCVIGAFFSFSCADAAAKYLLLEGMQPPYVVWSRYMGHAILAMLLLRIAVRPARMRISNLPLQILRGMCFVLSGLMAFYSLWTLQLVELVSIVFMAPLLITVLSGLILGERINGQRWIAVIVGLFGVLVITRPGFAEWKPGYAFAAGSTILYSFFAVATRKLSGAETEESLIVFPALVGVASLTPALPWVGSTPDHAMEWGVFLTIGVWGALGHWLLIRAHRVASASAIAPYGYSQMLGTLGFGYFLFGQMPDRWTLLGCSIIIAGGVYLIRLDRRSQPVAHASPLTGTGD
jgi:drug/metabolite transporter (DMT)-like permease